MCTYVWQLEEKGEEGMEIEREKEGVSEGGRERRTGGGRVRERERERDAHTYTAFTSSYSSDYQRISEQLKKRPPPWPSHDSSRPISTPPRRPIHADSSLPPTPQHQASFPSMGSTPGGVGGSLQDPRSRLDTINIRPAPRVPEGGYDAYDVSVCTSCTCDNILIG